MRQHPFDGVMGLAGIGRPRTATTRAFARIFMGLAPSQPQSVTPCTALFQPFQRRFYVVTMRMYSMHPLHDLARLLGLAHIFQDAAQPHHGQKMLRVQRQARVPDRPWQGQAPVHEPRGGAGVPAFGKVGRVVDHGREMVERGVGLPFAHGVAPALQQQVHAGRTRARPDARDLTFDALPTLLRRVGQPVQQDTCGSSVGGVLRVSGRAPNRLPPRQD